MTHALFVVDVQNDFCPPGGSLAVPGGDEVAAAITRFLREHRNRYDVVIASRDWHEPGSTNGGHFAAEGTDPDFAGTWPAHCVAGTPGADYHPALDRGLVDVHVRKGFGRPAYSIFDGATDDGRTTAQLIADHDVTHVDLVGIASDYCVFASATGALDAGLDVTVLTDLCAGVTPDTTRTAFDQLAAAGARLVPAGG